MAYLELRGLHKRFGEVVALEQFDLALARGEFVALLGPSGCGKTTALRIVAGFTAPDAGAVVLDGQDITGVPANRRHMGMVFQAYSLFPNMTAEENVEFGLRIRKVPPAERRRRVDELFALVGLEAARRRYPHQLSGGQQQRVALARALAIEPRVLLLDEPLSALDARVRVQLREEIRRIQGRLGITTLYVTHDQEEALSISDRVAVMAAGRIEQVGTAAEIYGAPATPFVAEFVGTMNRLPGRIVDGTRGLVECAGVQVLADAARGQRDGAPVLVLMRPEALEVEPRGDVPPGRAAPATAGGGPAAQAAGTGAPAGVFEGRIASRAFLGPITRVKIALASGEELAADIPSARADAFPVGTRVTARCAPEAVRLLPLASGPLVSGRR
ncbi:MAG: ABC transporter ATP-binding protein [Armatimonadota bacterium]|nr:ABC transporter ATP-binding protein [Armatimonadota bacterium]